MSRALRLTPLVWVAMFALHPGEPAQCVARGDNPSPVSTVWIHDTPDGFIERSVAVIVRERTIEVSIQIGINAKTMRDQLADWNIDETFETENALTRRYCELIPDHLLSQYKFSLDQQAIEMKVVSVDPFAEHHKTAVVRLTAQIPNDVESVSFQMLDHSFEQFDGAIRYAIKGRGKTLLTQSNVAPIIIRATRTELGSLSEVQRREICQIQARIRVLSK